VCVLCRQNERPIIQFYQCFRQVFPWYFERLKTKSVVKMTGKQDMDDECFGLAKVKPLFFLLATRQASMEKTVRNSFSKFDGKNGPQQPKPSNLSFISSTFSERISSTQHGTPARSIGSALPLYPPPPLSLSLPLSHVFSVILKNGVAV